jgi:hypothetical protein
MDVKNHAFKQLFGCIIWRECRKAVTSHSLLGTEVPRSTKRSQSGYNNAFNDRKLRKKKLRKKTTKNFADSKLSCNFATFFAPPEKRRPGNRTLKDLQ